MTVQNNRVDQTPPPLMTGSDKPMSTFRLVGADCDTGEDVTMTVSAADERQAVAKARSRGIFVSECQIVKSAGRATIRANVGEARKRPIRRTLLIGGIMVVVVLSVIAIPAWNTMQAQSSARRQAIQVAEGSYQASQKAAAAFSRQADEASQRADALRQKANAVRDDANNLKPLAEALDEFQTRMNIGVNLPEFRQEIIDLSLARGRIGKLASDHASARDFVTQADAAIEEYRLALADWQAAIKSKQMGLIGFAEESMRDEHMRIAQIQLEQAMKDFDRLVRDAG